MSLVLINEYVSQSSVNCCGEPRRYQGSRRGQRSTVTGKKAGERPLSSWGRGPTTSAGCRLPVYRYLQLSQLWGGREEGVPEARPVCHSVLPLLPREESLQTFFLQLHPAPSRHSQPCAARAGRPGFPGKRVCPRCFRGALHTSRLLAPRRPAGRRVWSPPPCRASSCEIPARRGGNAPPLEVAFPSRPAPPAFCWNSA